jgi:ribosomal-protein-alanine N-acetyltransferase
VSHGIPADLHTPRLVLRPFTLDDAAFILELVNEPAWLRFIGDKNVRGLEDARGYLRDGALRSYARFGFGLLCVTLRDSGEAIGMCGLLKRDSLPDPDVGFAFLDRFRGQGYAREALDAVVKLARARPGETRILAAASPDNERSLAVLESAGFRFERMGRLADDAPPVRIYALSWTS